MARPRDAAPMDRALAFEVRAQLGALWECGVHKCAQDHSLFAHFRDGYALVLPPACRGFILLHPHGDATLHTLEFPPSSCRARLAQALRFRNSCLERLARPSRRGACLASHARVRRPVVWSHLWDGPMAECGAAFARWPLWPAAGEQVRLRADGGVLVASSDGAVTLELAPSRRCFRVRFPAPLAGAVPQRWALVTQQFPLSRFPLCWQHPVELALRSLRDAAAEGSCEACDNPVEGALCAVELPLAESHGDARDLGVSLDGASRWWACVHADEGALPAALAVWAEWRPAATTFVRPGAAGADVVLHENGAVLESDGRGEFFRLHGPPGQAVRVFATDAAPPLWPPAGGRLKLAALLLRASHLLKHACSVASGHRAQAAPAQDSADLPQLSDAVVAQARLPSSASGAGAIVTAFADGRVRARFGDRTLLEWSRHTMEVDLTLADASRRRWLLSSPGAACDPALMRRYVAPVIKAAELLLLPDRERLEALRRRSLLHAAAAHSVSATRRWLGCQRFLLEGADAVK